MTHEMEINCGLYWRGESLKSGHVKNDTHISWGGYLFGKDTDFTGMMSPVFYIAWGKFKIRSRKK